MSRHRQNYFDRHIPEPRISNWQLAAYFAVILAVYAALSTLDYRDARKDECERKSNIKYQFTYDPSTDLCTKELRNGTTQKN